MGQKIKAMRESIIKVAKRKCLQVANVKVKSLACPYLEKVWRLRKEDMMELFLPHKVWFGLLAHRRREGCTRDRRQAPMKAVYVD